MDVSRFEGLKISIASPEKIREWSHGEVAKRSLDLREIMNVLVVSTKD